MRIGDVVQLDLTVRRGQSSYWERVYGTLVLRGQAYFVELFAPLPGVPKRIPCPPEWCPPEYDGCVGWEQRAGY